jgi:hypothetical protein
MQGEKPLGGENVKFKDYDWEGRTVSSVGFFLAWDHFSMKLTISSLVVEIWQKVTTQMKARCFYRCNGGSQGHCSRSPKSSWASCTVNICLQ